MTQRLAGSRAPVRHGAPVHPEDAWALARGPHGLRTQHAPLPWAGPPLTADIFLLYADPKDNGAAWLGAQRRNEHLPRENLTGRLPDPWFAPGHGGDDNGAAWLMGKVGRLMDKRAAMHRACVLELVAYRSPTFEDRHMARALPSSRLVANVLHTDILPRAARGEALVVCIWGAELWGLHPDMDVPGLVMACTNNRSGTLPGSSQKHDQIAAWIKARA